MRNLDAKKREMVVFSKRLKWLCCESIECKRLINLDRQLAVFYCEFLNM